MSNRVVRYHADRTNQKLYFARLACQQAETSPSAQIQQAARESAVFQLQGAVLAFLQELGRYYRVDERYPTVAGLKKALAQREQVSPEVSRLEQLTATGFLGELQRAYQSCEYAPEPPTPVPDQDTSSTLIFKVTQTPQAWLPDVAILREWQRELTQLIESFREGMVEF